MKKLTGFMAIALCSTLAISMAYAKPAVKKISQPTAKRVACNESSPGYYLCDCGDGQIFISNSSSALCEGKFAEQVGADNAAAAAQERARNQRALDAQLAKDRAEMEKQKTAAGQRTYTEPLPDSNQSVEVVQGGSSHFVKLQTRRDVAATCFTNLAGFADNDFASSVLGKSAMDLINNPAIANFDQFFTGTDQEPAHFASLTKLAACQKGASDKEYCAVNASEKRNIAQWSSSASNHPNVAYDGLFAACVSKLRARRVTYADELEQAYRSNPEAAPAGVGQMR